MEEKVNGVRLRICEVERNSIDAIKDNFGLNSYYFKTVPRKGELVELRKGVTPPKLYFVETVIHYGVQPDESRALSEARTTLFVSFFKNLPE